MPHCCCQDNNKYGARSHTASANRSVRRPRLSADSPDLLAIIKQEGKV